MRHLTLASLAPAPPLCQSTPEEAVGLLQRVVRCYAMALRPGYTREHSDTPRPAKAAARQALSQPSLNRKI